MSEVARALVAAGVAAILLLPRDARARDAAETAATIDDAAVVRIVLEKNPTVAAAMTEVRRAHLLEEAEEHRYPFTLLLDGRATRNAAPTIGPRGINFPESTIYLAGGELRRTLAWGTALSFRVEGFRQLSVTPFNFALPSATPGAPAGAPVQTLFRIGPGYGASARLGVTQPLLRGSGRDVVLAQLDQARASKTAAGSSRERTASQSLVDGLTAYWELYYATRAIEIQEKALATARQQRDEAAARVRTGSVAPVEQLTFESRVAQLEEELVGVHAEERRRSTALARVLGDATLTERRAAQAEPPRYPEPSADVRRRALETSPELVEQRAAVELAEVQARTAADPLRARLDLDAYVQAHGMGLEEVAPAFTQVGTLRAVSAQVALTYEAPLDNTRYRAERDRAELAVVVARQNLEAAAQKVVAELDDAHQRDRAARLRIALADRTVAIARDQLDAEQARFRTGGATALQVREAEDQLRNAELRAARARVDLAVAHLAIAHLTGALLAEAARRPAP